MSSLNGLKTHVDYLENDRKQALDVADHQLIMTITMLMSMPHIRFKGMLVRIYVKRALEGFYIRKEKFSQSATSDNKNHEWTLLIKL